MKTTNLLSVMLVIAFSFFACKKLSDSTFTKKNTKLSQLAEEYDGVYFEDVTTYFQIEKNMASLVLMRNGIIENVIYLGNDNSFNNEEITPKQSIKSDILYFNGGLCLIVKENGEKILMKIDNEANKFVLKNIDKEIFNGAKILEGSYLGKMSKVNKNAAILTKYPSLTEGVMASFEGEHSDKHKISPNDVSTEIDGDNLGTTCLSGGPGSTSCSFSGNIAGNGVECNVSCSTGFYSCCGSFTSPPFCRCIKQ